MFPFDLDSLRGKAKSLEKLSYEEGFWNDIEKAQKTMQEIKGLNTQIKEYEDLIAEIGHRGRKL